MTNLNKPTGTLPEMTVRFTDGTSFAVKPSIGDMAHYDVIRPRKGWPKRDEAEVLFMSALCWIAGKRTGKTTMPLDDFINALDEIDVPDMDDESPTEPERTFTDDDLGGASPLDLG